MLDRLEALAESETARVTIDRPVAGRRRAGTREQLTSVLPDYPNEDGDAKPMTSKKIKDATASAFMVRYLSSVILQNFT